MELAALIIAFVALGVAIASARYTKSQADAALGNIAPTIELRVGKAQQFGQSVDLICTNHNKEPVFLTRCKFRVPPSIRVMHKRSPGKDALSGPESDVRMPFPVKIGSASPGANPSVFLFVLVPEEGADVPANFELRVETWFRIGNSRRVKRVSGFAPVKTIRAKVPDVA